MSVPRVFEFDFLLEIELKLKFVFEFLFEAVGLKGSVLINGSVSPVSLSCFFLVLLLLLFRIGFVISRNEEISTGLQHDGGYDELSAGSKVLFTFESKGSI